VIEKILPVVVLLFPVSEIVLAVLKRSRDRAVHRQDKGSIHVLWASIFIGLTVAAYLSNIGWGRISWPGSVRRLVALLLLVAGLGLRWVAILTLGRLFTVDVAILTGHRVVQNGPYRFVRHPSYSGLLVVFLGVGVYFGSWLSLIAMMVPIIVAVFNRVRKEEAALIASLGPEYASYCSRTKRFIPGLV